jgi:hypothetical protein
MRSPARTRATKLVDEERLGDVVVRAAAEPGHLRLGGRIAGEDDDVGVLVAVAVRQAPVEKDEVPRFLQRLPGLGDVRGMADVRALAAKGKADEAHDAEIIFNHNDFAAVHGRFHN